MIVAFDIETIPDLTTGEKLYGLEGIEPKEAAKAMLAARRTRVPDAVMLPLHLHQVVAISVAVRWGENNFVVKSLGSADSSEKELVQTFFRSVDKNPTLVSWNGNGFDLPVLQYRAMYHSIQNVRYWDTGAFDREAKWNNYQSRYHDRHVDIMDVLARYSYRGVASLDDIAQLTGLPGKIGIGGASVFDAYLDGKHEEIRNYCEMDSLNTYLIFLRLQYIRGHFTDEKYQHELQKAYTWLSDSDKEHFAEYASRWKPLEK